MLTRRLGSAAVAVAVTLVAAAMSLQAAKPPTVDGSRLAFHATDLDGNAVASDDSRFVGKVLLVDLWGSRCSPCVSEIDTLNDLQRRHRERGLVIVAIAFEDLPTAAARRDHLRAVAREHGINYLVLDGGRPEDFEAALPNVRNVKGFPVEIVIDRGGRVVDARHGYGYTKKWARRLDEELRELLAHDY